MELDVKLRTNVLLKKQNYRFIFAFRVNFQEEGHASGYIPRGIIPVDDIGNSEPPGYAPGEKELRCKLASRYRVVDHLGWSQAIFNHITVTSLSLYTNFVIYNDSIANNRLK